MSDTHFDVIIIGSGAGGGTLAHRLAPSGKRILLLERGGYVPREKDNWSSPAVFLDGKYNAHDTWYEKGCRPFPLPIGLMLDEQHPETSRCIRCDTCDGLPCLVNAKADAHVICVEPALRHPNVSLITHARVTHLDTSASGREVTAVHVEHEGGHDTYSAGIIVVSCGAVNSAVLLLRSASDTHPGGLANRSGVVGRHYMAHNNSPVLALSKRPDPTTFQKTLGLNDFYFASKAWDYPMGHIQMLGKSDAEMLNGDAPFFAPGMALEQVARHSIDCWITSEDLPDPNNRVALDDKGRVTIHYTPNNLEDHLLERLT